MASVKKYQLDDMSLEDLWHLHNDLTRILTRRCERQKQLVEQQLAELGRRFGGSPNDVPKPRPYPPVTAKYRNPGLSSETWSGRGKQPRWVIEWLASGRPLDDCRTQ
ncbi:H-NS histone family protein [Bradyrhizobium sp. WYCCWR 13023]|uniref:H-NS histone family protein n=1 Tax=Bradyrhizobium zhengyangense TaxID=2911009 RepID=A0A9X1UCQ9_9BRAD|nr:H-NS histone family protein [Bradyrhizobium zhengyangense]MCG2632701.1 H-NS histone family protein [Bradyrhizobium zhengyangense]